MKKIKLKELKVQSFITSFKRPESENIKGGTALIHSQICLTIILDTNEEACIDSCPSAVLGTHMNPCAASVTGC